MSTLFQELVHVDLEDPQYVVMWPRIEYNTCKYNGCSCGARRAIKRNGKLHRFCEDHRLRHIAYQKKSMQKKLERHVQQYDLLDLDEGLSVATAVTSDDMALWSGEERHEELMKLLYELPPLDCADN